MLLGLGFSNKFLIWVLGLTNGVWGLGNKLCFWGWGFVANF
jgi:hypothetical protein